MTIKTECVIKSVKSDYRIIVPVIILFAAIIGLIYGFTIYGDKISQILSTISAVSFFIIFQLIAMVALPIIIISGDYTKTSRETFKGESNTPLLILINCIFMVIIYGCYQVSSCSLIGNTCKYPDVLVIFIILLLINALIISPLTIAYARCKE